MAVENNRLGGFNPNVGTFGVRKGKRPENMDGMRAEEQNVQRNAQPQDRTQVSPNDVLSFMANSSVYNAVAASKKIDVSKYVTPEQRERIAGSMRSFENKFTEKLDKVTEEIPGVNQSTAMAIAAKMIENEMA